MSDTNLSSLNPLHPKNPSQQVHQSPSGGSTEAHHHDNTEDESDKKDHTYSEGYENVMLPSKGLFYVGDAKHIEYIPVRPFDYTDEDILLTPSFYDNGTIYTELLNNVILSKVYLKSKNLVPIDRDTILIWLRANSFGNTFKVEYECPKCEMGSGEGIKGKGGEMTWQLQDIKIPEYSSDVYNELFENGEIKIVTPQKGLNLRITVPTLAVQESLEKKFKLKKEKEKIKKEFFASITLLSVVSGIDLDNGKVERDKNRIDQIFKQNRLSLVDSRYILEKAREINLRYDTRQTFICKDCNHIQEGVEMPILHKNFFWPESEL